MAQQEQELEFDGDFDPEELEDSEQDDQTRYVFDPDTDSYDQIMYDPRRRRRAKTKTRWRTRVKRVYRRARAKVKRKKPSIMGWQTLLAIPVALISFIVSMQQDTMAWYVEHNPEGIKHSFSPYELLKTLGGGWGRPKDIMAYIKNVFTSPLGLGGIALTVYALLPFKRLPLKRIALICGGALVIGSLLGSALHASGEESNNHSGMRSGISERQAYSHVLTGDPFNR